MPTDSDIYGLHQGLKQATGHMAWAWDGNQHFVTHSLNQRLADFLAGEIEGLGGRVSCLPEKDGTTTLSIQRDDANDFIEREARDRAHRTRSADDDDILLEFLAVDYPGFVWRPYEQGYVGYGFDLSQRKTLLEPFHRHGIRPQDIDIVADGEASTHGIFLSVNQAEQLMVTQHHQTCAR